MLNSYEPQPPTPLDLSFLPDDLRDMYMKLAAEEEPQKADSWLSVILGQPMPG